MTSSVNRVWEVYCQTEQANIPAISTTEPTECPNDSGHAIGDVRIMAGSNLLASQRDTFSIPLVTTLPLATYHEFITDVLLPGSYRVNSQILAATLNGNTSLYYHVTVDDTPLEGAEAADIISFVTKAPTDRKTLQKWGYFHTAATSAHTIKVLVGKVGGNQRGSISVFKSLLSIHRD